MRVSFPLHSCHYLAFLVYFLGHSHIKWLISKKQYLHVHWGWTFSNLLFAFIFLVNFLFLSFVDLYMGVFRLFLSVSHICWIIFLSLLVIIIFLVLPCKNFNWYAIAYKSDFQNVNDKYNRDTNPSGWVLPVHRTRTCPSVHLSCELLYHSENRKRSPSKTREWSWILFYFVFYICYVL